MMLKLKNMIMLNMNSWKYDYVNHEVMKEADEQTR